MSVCLETSILETPDELTQKEECSISEEAERTSLKGMQQDIEERKTYANRIYWLIVWWLAGVAVIVMFGSWHISDKVLITLVGGTTINVLGIFAIVAKYLFNRR